MTVDSVIFLNITVPPMSLPGCHFWDPGDRGDALLTEQRHWMKLDGFDKTNRSKVSQIPGSRQNLEAKV